MTEIESQNSQHEFKSDFLLDPLNFKSRSGLATWHNDTDPAVHDLMDGFRTDPVCYSRKRLFDGKYQDCQVIIEENGNGNENGNNIVLLPGDGTRYSVTRVTHVNKINDEKADDSSDACVICFEYVKNHVSIPCGHIVTCQRCTKRLEEQDDRCPLCRVPTSQLLRVFK